MKIRASRTAEVSADCMVYKADAGEAEGKQSCQVWTGMEGALLKLKPGYHDVIVENREDANGLPVSSRELQSRWAKQSRRRRTFPVGR